MRALHKVAAHEKFLASGEYRYWRGEENLKIRDKWTIHELRGEALFYRLDEEGEGLSIISEALINPDGQMERFNIQSWNPTLFKADYIFNPNDVQISRRLQGKEPEYEEFPLLPDSLIYIKQMLFMGWTIANIEKAGGKSQVFTPQLFADTSNQMQKIVIKAQGEESIMLGQKSILTRKFQIADDVFYWLDVHNIPIQREYQHEGTKYRVTIANYAYR
jgi:hypothetical protein